MANEEQLELLKQGVKRWNQWREDHSDEKIDLSKADLSKADLLKANLREANLREASLREADLYKANLHKANLYKANLSEAFLSEADLSGALLWVADLSGAFLCVANLRGADLSETNLSEVDLREADLSGTNLREANLSFAQLSLVTLTDATLTCAYLYGTARDDWKIEGILCDYVFWEDKPVFYAAETEQAQQWEAAHRTPKDRNFRPGEFEELYKQLPTFEYVFEHGFTALDAVVMDRIVAAINAQHPEFELTLDSFQSRGQPHAKFTVLHQEQVAAAKQQVTTDYESRMAALEGKVEQLTKMFALVGSGNITMHEVGGNVIIQQAGHAIEAGNIVAGNQDQR